jgi:hypothetical protein
MPKRTSAQPMIEGRAAGAGRNQMFLSKPTETHGHRMPDSASGFRNGEHNQSFDGWILVVDGSAAS